MTLTLTQLAQFTLGAVLIVLLPGPNSLFVATTAAKVSRAAGWRAALGVFIGDGVLMVMAVLGAGTLLAGGSVFFRLLTLAGGAYLAWLGFGLIRQGIALRREARLLPR
ncbi:LysE family transporter [Dermacoccus abyssi]|uniref:LysE family transporter n=1 Tax=Dermacoccus abyssi TaxID=322596 RepID=UPI002AD45B54|nr:LysE family transporter [Dermacoccus abyssi]